MISQDGFSASGDGSFGLLSALTPVVELSWDPIAVVSFGLVLSGAALVALLSGTGDWRDRLGNLIFLASFLSALLKTIGTGAP